MVDHRRTYSMVMIGTDEGEKFPGNFAGAFLLQSGGWCRVSPGDDDGVTRDAYRWASGRRA